ncbi:hypothetical protein BJ165DRAFT_1612448 [Panaeolus papilionaceus]|nr:hypothetical protein BJ165DRAFT_1612448 [Panaeolus papilionaceus]
MVAGTRLASLILLLPILMAGESLTPTYGIWLVCLFLESILYGCGLLQAWLYFHWYTRDHWSIKTMVAALVTLETIQIVFYFATGYQYLVTNFGNFENLQVINWEDSVQLAPTYLTAFLVQLYFASCIYMLKREAKVVPILIAVFALTQLGAGIAQDVVVSKLKVFSKLGETAPVYALQSAATLTCDLLITGALLVRLNKAKSGTKASNSMLDMLMINAINRGGLTVLAATLNLVLVLALPKTFYFFIGLILSSKLYMNSALATLNSRQHIRDRFNNVIDDSLSWRLGTISGSIRPNNASRTVEVNIHSEVHTDSELEVKRGNFTDGML